MRPIPPAWLCADPAKPRPYNAAAWPREAGNGEFRHGKQKQTSDIIERRHSGNAKRNNVLGSVKGARTSCSSRRRPWGPRRRRRHDIYSIMLCHTRVPAEPGQELGLGTDLPPDTPTEAVPWRTRARRVQKDTGRARKQTIAKGAIGREQEKNVIPTLTQVGLTRL